MEWKDMGMCQGYAITLIDHETGDQSDCAAVSIDAKVTAILAGDVLKCSKK